MPKRLISLLLAATLTVSPLAAQSVQAQEADEVVGIIAGIAALAIIGAAINESRNDKKKSETVRRSTSHAYDGRAYGWSHGRPGNSAKHWRNRSWRDLPAACRRIFDTPRGDRTVYGARCLERNYEFTRFLPERCERQIRTNRGLRPVYGARCLEREGFRVEARSHLSR